jgi:hypothetical protein
MERAASRSSPSMGRPVDVKAQFPFFVLLAFFFHLFRSRPCQVAVLASVGAAT